MGYKGIMTKRLLQIVCILLSLSSCGEDMAYRIEGKLANLEDKTLYAVFENEDSKVVDTVFCEKPGQFLIEEPKEGFETATIFFDNKTRWITVYLEPGEKITITGDAHYPSMIQIKGGRINDELSIWKKEVGHSLKEQADLIHILNKKDNHNNTIEETDVASCLTNVNHQLSELAMAFIQENPDEKASVVLIRNYFTNPDDTRKMDELLAILNPKLKDFYLVKELEQYIEKAKRTILGAEAPGFAVKDIYGHPVSLDSFPQKYLLLTFTAPWCDMCQTEDLYLDQVATKYPKDKLGILLISLDDKQDEVRQVLAKDSIAWNLVTDSAGQAAMLVDLYNVSALPRCFLIDEEGKIILKTDNGMEIKQALESLMK